MSELELAEEMIDPDLPGYAIAEKGPSEIEGLFLFRFIETEFAGTQKPTFLSVDNGSIERGDQLIINGKNYRVKDNHPDGVGLVLFILEAF